MGRTGRFVTSVAELGLGLGVCREEFLSIDEVRSIIKGYPYVIPTVPTNAKVFEGIDVGDFRCDYLIVSRLGRSGPTIHVVTLKWFNYGLSKSGTKDVRDLVRELEFLDSVYWDLETLGSCRASWALRLKSMVKSVLGVRRLRISEVFINVVFRELSGDVIDAIDIVNDLVDAYVDATEFRRFLCGNASLIQVRTYTWR